MDYYPQEFSARARARVEAERLRASQELDSAQAKRPPADWKRSTRVWDQCEFYSYILRVFLVFGQEACQLGKQGIWTVDHVRSEANEFLRRFTIEAYFERGRDRYGETFPDMTSHWDGSLLPEVGQTFRRSEEWRQFESQLLAVSEDLANDGPELVGAPAPEPNERSGGSLEADQAALLHNETVEQVVQLPHQHLSSNAEDPEFDRLAIQNPYVEAYWDSLQKRWLLRDRPTDAQGKPSPYHSIAASEEVTEAAKKAARIAVSRLRTSRDAEIKTLANTLREPLSVWLDLMRAKERGFRLIPQLTRWRGGKSIEEFQRSGLVPPDARITGNGFIRGFFRESATFWEDLVALGFDSVPAKGSDLPAPASENVQRAETDAVIKRSPPLPNGANVTALPQHQHHPKQLVRRNERYKKIDVALRQIAESHPQTQEEVFQALEGRVTFPPAEPFLSAGGWVEGFRRDEPAARAWLSKRWGELELPSLPRGPKK